VRFAHDPRRCRGPRAGQNQSLAEAKYGDLAATVWTAPAHRQAGNPELAALSPIETSQTRPDDPQLLNSEVRPQHRRQELERTEPESAESRESCSRESAPASPRVATGYEDESKRASSSSSRRAKRKSPAYKPSSSSSVHSSKPSPEGSERGLASQRSSTSASFADPTARRRRPVSIASSEGAGSGGKSLRLARRAALRLPASRAVSDVNGRPCGRWRGVVAPGSSAFAAALTVSHAALSRFEPTVPTREQPVAARRRGIGAAGKFEAILERHVATPLVAEKLGRQRRNGASLAVLCVPFLPRLPRGGWRGVSCSVMQCPPRLRGGPVRKCQVGRSVPPVSDGSRRRCRSRSTAAKRAGARVDPRLRSAGV
jgi:hypothetical protein